MENKQLPEKWCIKFTTENEEILKKWIKSHEDFKPDRSGEFTGWCLCDKYVDGTYMFWAFDVPKGYTEITLEEFKKHILKEETMEEKKIIGYKLVKPEYREVAEKIGDLCNWKGFENYVNTPHKESYEKCAKKLKEAGVLDLWFEPIFEKELKVGDWIYFIKSFDGAPKGHLAKITRIAEDSIYPGSKWIGYSPKIKMGGGFRWKGNGYKLGIDFRKATKEEIEEYNKPKLPVINNYSGRIKGDYVIYGSNCAKFHKDFFRNLFNTYCNISLSQQNRKVVSIKLDSGVEITIEQIKQIVECINKN